ncbi:MAG: tRNA (adenosine(37)-N6)-dimethylallyltransferase MiaA [Verrucomicrobiales bacterium]|nr:tRNA (adenosine(37)-N6)-dimethylallyltransferase MiaA [Verrucomicrobiales bacterium]
MNTPFFPIYLAGPTGSGKTAVAIELASAFAPLEIVNADAFQIYRGMEIISAAPSEAEKTDIPHHLFEIIDPSESCDAAHFAEVARRKITNVAETATPLVVGGSGLYLKAITHGLAPTPKSDPKLRAELDGESLEALVGRYKDLDPEGAAATNLRNRRYVTRNLEICLLAGEPASTIKNSWQNDQPKLCSFFLKRSREAVYERINRRTSAMFEAGVVREIEALGELSPTAEKAIGVREIQDLIVGKIDEQTCIEAIRQATRRYAKRQESWFKREPSFQTIEIVEDDTPETIVARILPRIQSFSPAP